jgi:hypothetical protein
MPKPIYIALGNHRSLVGIKEVIYSLSSCLSENFTVRLTRGLRHNHVNIIIDEFSMPIDVLAIEKTKKLYPDTKIVVVATEFITPVSLFGIEFLNTFNFFGTLNDWRTLLRYKIKSSLGGLPSYMQLRYRGFVGVLKHCDILAVLHPRILPEVTKLAASETRLAPPLMVHPQIGALGAVQQGRLADLPVGFALTGTLTGYRRRITRSLIQQFQRVGWFGPLYKHVPFEAANATSSEYETDFLKAEYDSIEPDYLFNLNPPQTENWPYSSPMRILRAVLLGQIPVVTEKFHDHMLEDIAMLWDGKLETALELGSWQFLDRQVWLNGYLRSIETYDRRAKEANKPFVDAMVALVGGERTGSPTTSAGKSDGVATFSRAGQRR